jgi:hypothetical protein
MKLCEVGNLVASCMLSFGGLFGIVPGLPGLLIAVGAAQKRGGVAGADRASTSREEIGDKGKPDCCGHRTD